MGLTLGVGILADLLENDTEGADWYISSFGAINKILASMGLPCHEEPRRCDEWSADMYGYYGLHYLRRLSAYLDTGMSLPPPGNDASPTDPQLVAYNADVGGRRPRLWSRIIGSGPKYNRSFDHLIVHSDAEGFYLPIDFEDVIITESEDVPGGMIGSVPRLYKELRRLAVALEIPADLTADSERLWDAAEAQGVGGALWEKYGIESYSCVVLKEGCEHSLRTGAALVFA